MVWILSGIIVLLGALLIALWLVIEAEERRV
jgi:hypothetical protein